MIYADYTDIGGRPENEDSLAAVIRDDMALFAVADGLGGHGGGGDASGIAVDTLSRGFGGDPASFKLETAVLDANARIRDAQSSLRCDMMTTIAAVVVGRGTIRMASVGDSRIYAFKNGKIVFQSRDHSVPQMLADLGSISPEDIRTHTDRNVITSCLGASDELSASVTEFGAECADALLLCSDGFWEYVREDDMLSALESAKTPREWLDKMLVILKNTRTPDCDNSTAVCVFPKGRADR